MRWQMLARCCVSRNRTFDSISLPQRSMKVFSGPFTMISLIDLVLEQWFERSQTQDVVHQFAGQRTLLTGVELHAPLGGDLRDQPFHVGGQPIFRHGGDRRGIEPREADVAQLDDRFFRRAGRLERCGDRRRRGFGGAAAGRGRSGTGGADAAAEGLGSGVHGFAGTDSSRAARPMRAAGRRRATPNRASRRTRPGAPVRSRRPGSRWTCHRRLAQGRGVADLARQVGNRDVHFHLQRVFHLPARQAAGDADAVQDHDGALRLLLAAPAAPANAACRAPPPASAPSPARAGPPDRANRDTAAPAQRARRPR